MGNYDYCEKSADKVAKFLTVEFANKYIHDEYKYGRWPVHLLDPKYLLEEDLGKALKLVGDKKYFNKFYKHSKSYIAGLLRENNGQLELSDSVSEELSYKNLEKLLAGFPELSRLCVRSEEKSCSNFYVKINKDKVNCSVNSCTYNGGDENSSDYYHYEQEL